MLSRALANNLLVSAYQPCHHIAGDMAEIRCEKFICTAVGRTALAMIEPIKCRYGPTEQRQVCAKGPIRRFEPPAIYLWRGEAEEHL